MGSAARFLALHKSFPAPRKSFSALHKSLAARGLATSSDVGSDIDEMLDFSTLCAQHYHVHEASLAGVAPPIVPSSTFLLSDAEHSSRLAAKHEAVESDDDGFFYSRWGSPTNQLAGRIVSALEGAKGTFVFGSGMNAITTTLLTILRSGDHVVAPKALYGGTHEWLSIWGPRLGIDVTLVDATTVSNYADAIRPNTRLLYAETPANPTMRLTDLEALGLLALEARAQSNGNVASHTNGDGTNCGVRVIVDGTFATPYHVRPLQQFPGVDAVIHAGTKYFGGHSDILAGTVSSNDAGLLQALGKASKLFGGPLAPFDAFLLARGLKTLDVRMARHAENAMEVARFLDMHPLVDAVFYPGLQSHPDHSLAQQQFRNGFGGMVAFDVAGGEVAGKRFVENVRLINLAVSLGGVESLVEHAASMTHTMVPADERREAGITDGLIRLSVGLESAKDIIADIDQALQASQISAI